MESRHQAKSRCLLKQTSSYERGGDGDSNAIKGQQALSENERKPLFALANSELRAKFAHGGRSEISKQGAKRCCEKMSDGGPKRFLAWSISLSYALETKVRNPIDGTTSRCARSDGKRFGIYYRHYRYMYLKMAWHLKTYIDSNSSIDFEKLH